MMSVVAIIGVALSVFFRWFSLLVFLIFALTSMFWQVWLLGLALTLLVYFIWTKQTKLILTAFIVSLLLLPMSFNTVSKRMDYFGELIKGQGAQALTTIEKTSIYLGNISMALVGFAIIAPEVAVETLLLMDPSGQDRHFKSDFAMKSLHVRNLIDDYTQKVKAGDAPLNSPRIPLRWGPGYNSYSMFDYRVALAVAGGGLWLEYEKTETGYDIKCRVTIDVKYSEKYQLDVFEAYGVRLYIEEAIFSALQDVGWLHPYYAHYYWATEA